MIYDILYIINPISGLVFGPKAGFNKKAENRPKNSEITRHTLNKLCYTPLFSIWAIFRKIPKFPKTYY